MTFRHTTVLRLFTLALLAASLAGSSLRADGLIHKLPEDGTKVTFKTEFTSTPAPPPEFKVTVTLSSVGKVMHEGKACRWLELGFLTEWNEVKRAEYFKLLVPEEQLKEGGNPIKNVVKIFQKQEGTEPREATDAADPFKGPLPVLFGGPLKKDEDAKPPEKTTLKTGLGDLECTGNRGIYSYEKDGSIFMADIESLVHEKAPFGVARMAIQFNTKQGDREEKGTLTLTVEKVSTGAESKMPNVK